MNRCTFFNFAFTGNPHFSCSSNRHQYWPYLWSYQGRPFWPLWPFYWNWPLWHELIWPQIWLIVVSIQRTGKMWITCESGVEKYASVQKLWPKQNRLWNYGHFLCILGIFLTENDHSRGSTSHGSSEVIFMFLESVEQCEWD